jgi:outer membrane immunogenic protein
MKKLLIASVAAAAAFCGAPAFAADMPVKAPAYRTDGPGYNWSGCYLGVEGGGAWGRTKQIDEVPGNFGFGQAMQNTHVDGGLAGGTAGCNYQTSRWVWGFEGDLSWANLKGQAPPSAIFSQQAIGAKVSWLDTLRGRIGYAADRTLFYVTGGAAFANVRATELTNQGIPNAVARDRSGLAVGAGVEWALADPHWSLKAEYLYVDFGKKLYVFEPNSLDRSVRLNENIVRIGLNYKFGDWGKGPVSAKY